MTPRGGPNRDFRISDLVVVRTESPFAAEIGIVGQEQCLSPPTPPWRGGRSSWCGAEVQRRVGAGDAELEAISLGWYLSHEAVGDHLLRPVVLKKQSVVMIFVTARSRVARL